MKRKVLSRSDATQIGRGLGNLTVCKETSEKHAMVVLRPIYVDLSIRYPQATSTKDAVLFRLFHSTIGTLR